MVGWRRGEELGREEVDRTVEEVVGWVEVVRVVVREEICRVVEVRVVAGEVVGMLGVARVAEKGGWKRGGCSGGRGSGWQVVVRGLARRWLAAW